MEKGLESCERQDVYVRKKKLKKKEKRKGQERKGNKRKKKEEGED